MHLLEIHFTFIRLDYISMMLTLLNNFHINDVLEFVKQYIWHTQLLAASWKWDCGGTIEQLCFLSLHGFLYAEWGAITFTRALRFEGTCNACYNILQRRIQKNLPAANWNATKSLIGCRKGLLDQGPQPFWRHGPPFYSPIHYYDMV